MHRDKTSLYAYLKATGMCEIGTREVGGLLSKNYLDGMDKQQVIGSLSLCSISCYQQLESIRF